MAAECETNEKTVLIAVDSSENAERAFDFYMTALHKPGYKIVIVHSAETPNLSAISLKSPMSMPVEEWTDILTKRHEEATKLEQHYISRLLHSQAKYKTHVIQGKAGECICKTADEDHVDMIVMGTRGQNAIRRTFLGSVSDYVVHHATVPVIICPPPPKHGHKH